MNIPLRRVFDMRTGTSLGLMLIAFALLSSPSAAQTRGSTVAGDSTTTPSTGRTSGMAQDSTTKRGPYADIAPALDDFTQRVLFGEVWERPGLSKRDRSLITVATLVANYRTNELPYHLKFALQNGVTKDELTELITHLAFYAGWPTANSAIEIARKVFAESPK
jgi:4-carboxymuconolactone decarboxylase